MTEAVKQICGRIFANTDILRIYAEPFSYNTGSRRALEKAGFRYEGLMRCNAVKNGKTVDMCLYSLTRSMDPYPIRRLSPEEIPAALELCWQVFQEFEAPEYAPEGISAFRASLDDRERTRKLSFYGAFDGGRLVGALCMRAPQHIADFFVDAAYHRRGIGRRLNVEPYGGMIQRSWLDRPLSVAGRALVRRNGRLETALVNIDRDLAIIPSVAIHMDRDVNKSGALNAAVDLQPLFTQGDVTLRTLAAAELHVEESDLLDTELFLYPRMKAVRLGADGEFIASPRLDDLQCVFALLQGFLAAGDSEAVPVLAVFNNEEVGSGTRRGRIPPSSPTCWSVSAPPRGKRRSSTVPPWGRASWFRRTMPTPSIPPIPNLRIRQRPPR